MSQLSHRHIARGAAAVAAALLSLWTSSGAAAPISTDGAATLAVGDLDGDTYPELVVAGVLSNQLVVYRGGADGTFAASRASTVATGVTVPAEAIPRRQAVAIGDVNLDGKPDLIVSNSAAGTVSVLLGHGDRSFQPAAALQVLPLPSGVVIADLDRDGRPDVVVASQATGKVETWLGSGDGRFRRGGEFLAGNGALGIVAADLGTSGDNPAHDGKIDVAVAVPGDGRVAVLFGDGRGGLSAPLLLDVPGATALAAADFNGDGATDLVATSASEHSVIMNIGYTKAGFGCFANGTEEVNLGPTLRPTGVAAVDLNHDGNLDLVVSAESMIGKSGGLFLLISHPRAHMRLVYFDDPGFCPIAGAPAAVAAAQADGSGAVQVAVPDAHADSTSVMVSDVSGNSPTCARQSHLALTAANVASTEMRVARAPQP